MARSAIRESRIQENEKEETYTPPFSFDVPAKVRQMFENEGYHLRWIRVLIDNQDDYKNVADRRREGYEPVQISELPDEFRDLFETKSFGPGTAKYSNIAMVGDLALFKITLSKVRARQRYYEQMSLNNEVAQMKQLSSDSKLNKILPIFNESTTQVRVGSRGNSAPSEFGKTLKNPTSGAVQDNYDE